MENEYKTAIINIANELDKRCTELVNPFPDSEFSMIAKLEEMVDIIKDTMWALEDRDVRDLVRIANKLKEQRLKTYENEEAERDRENA